MVHQLVLGLEGLLLPGAVHPVAAVVIVLWSAHVVHRQMVHNVVERVEHAAAYLLGVLVLPHAHRLLLDRLAHVPVVGGHVAAVAGHGAAIVVAGRSGHIMEAEGIEVVASTGGDCCCTVQAAGEHGVGGGGGGGGQITHVPPQQQVPGVGRHGRGRLTIGLIVAGKRLHLQRGCLGHHHCAGLVLCLGKKVSQQWFALCE